MKLLLFLLCPYLTIKKDIRLKETKHKEYRIIYTMVHSLVLLLVLFWILNLLTFKPIHIA